jgi:hypothetical protein
MRRWTSGAIDNFLARPAAGLRMSLVVCGAALFAADDIRDDLRGFSQLANQRRAAQKIDIFRACEEWLKPPMVKNNSLSIREAWKGIHSPAMTWVKQLPCSPCFNWMIGLLWRSTNCDQP